MSRIYSPLSEKNLIYDFIIIGGGATGLGTALDAASRGYRTLLVEQSDFAKGTSSRSTKLIHGGVRYLAQGNIGLVKHALKERGLLQKNAAHLVQKEEFIIPCYSWFAVIKYIIGLKIYDWLSGKLSFGKSELLSKQQASERLPEIKKHGLKGAIRYFDGKFDDARLAVNIAQTAIEQGATLLTYTKVIGLQKDNGIVNGVHTRDVLTGREETFSGRVVINATGVFVDDILKMNNPDAENMVRPSQGVHLVLNKKFLKSESALMIPKTSDGRVLFAVPWHGHVLVGTTDTPLDKHNLEPRALKEEVDFILNTASDYFNQKPTENDILSVFSGLRPLAAPKKAGKNNTKEISRDHKLTTSAKGLLTITGGKWTTYRLMAEDTVNLAIKTANLLVKPCLTKSLKIHGCTTSYTGDFMDRYGTDRPEIEALIKENPELGTKLHPRFPYTKALVVWAVTNEMAETVEDVLSRRLRVLFIDAQAAIEMSKTVASILAKALHANQEWEHNQVEIFNNLASGYIYQQKNL